MTFTLPPLYNTSLQAIHIINAIPKFYTPSEAYKLKNPVALPYVFIYDQSTRQYLFTLFEEKAPCLPFTHTCFPHPDKTHSNQTRHNFTYRPVTTEVNYLKVTQTFYQCLQCCFDTTSDPSVSRAYGITGIFKPFSAKFTMNKAENIWQNRTDCEGLKYEIDHVAIWWHSSRPGIAVTNKIKQLTSKLRLLKNKRSLGPAKTRLLSSYKKTLLALDNHKKGSVPLTKDQLIALGLSSEVVPILRIAMRCQNQPTFSQTPPRFHVGMGGHTGSNRKDSNAITPGQFSHIPFELRA